MVVYARGLYRREEGAVLPGKGRIGAGSEVARSATHDAHGAPDCGAPTAGTALRCEL